MKKAALAAVFLFAAPAFAQERLKCGTVETLELTSLTRTKATAFLRTKLPVAPAGAKESFEGKIEVANTRIPVAMPVTVMVQRTAEGAGGAAGAEAVFLTDLDLSKIPAELLGRLHPAALDVTFEGNLRGPSGAMPVCAAGVLKIGSKEIRAAGPVGQDYAKFGGVKLRGMSLAETEGTASVVLYNPLSFALDVKGLVWEVQAGGRRVASGEAHALRLHPGRENSIDLPVSASNAELAAVFAGALASGGRVDGRLLATLTVKVGKDQQMTVPLDLPGTIQVIR